ILLYVPVTLLALADLTTSQISGELVHRYWGWTYEIPASALSFLTSSTIFTLGILTVFFCVRYYLNQTERLARKRAAFVALGFSVPFVSSMANEAILYSSLAWRVPEFEVFLFCTLGLGVIAYAIRRYQLLDIDPAFAADKIVSTISEGLFIVSPECTLVYANDAALEMLGFSHEEIVGRACPMFSSHDEMVGLCALEADQAGIKEAETTMKTRDGRVIPVSMSHSILRGRRDRVDGCLFVIRDISRRKQAETELMEQQTELAARNEALSTLYDISSAFSQETDLNKLLTQALDMITGLDLFDVQRKGGIFLVEGRSLRLFTHLGHDKEFFAAHENLGIDNDCLCGLAARTGEIIISTNSSEDSRHGIRYKGMKPHGHIVLPVKAGNAVVGVLYLYLPVDKTPDSGKVRLLAAISNQMGSAVKRAMLFEETRALSQHDSLTGLANRNLMKETLRKTFARSCRNDVPCSVIMLDLDYFKDFNDTWGHVAGDGVLTDVSRIMLEETRDMDTVTRFGGEEFLIVLPDTDEDEAVEAAERIRRQIESTEFRLLGHATAHITISGGSASFDPGVTHEDILIHRADNALYKAKRLGRNRIERWTGGRGPDDDRPVSLSPQQPHDLEPET
ncbi:MAG: diguanylate cyclase, partial [Thermoleophilia bacterium]|nr:diguanylate cyclase [Thermoleophilia bacterium]